MKNISILIAVFFLCCSIVIAQQFYLKQTLFEGQQNNYTVDGYTYTIKLTAVYDSVLKAQFLVNNETTEALSKDESYALQDGASIYIRSILPSDDGNDFVQFNFFPVHHNVSVVSITELVEIKIDNISTTNSIENAVDKTEPIKDNSTVLKVPELAPERMRVPASAPIVQSFWQKIISWLRNIKILKTE